MTEAVKPHAGGTEPITPFLPDLTVTAARANPLSKHTRSCDLIDILTIRRVGSVLQLMTHPVSAYLHVLRGDLTVEFLDDKRQDFQALVQSRATMTPRAQRRADAGRFLAALPGGAKDVPTILHPPAAAISQKEG
jgi:hypothetical protein